MSTLLRSAILTGPTACGKTSIALDFARTHPHVEIVNADSLLFYRGLAIGTAKPSPQELAEIPHHLLDLIAPNETFTAGDFHRAVVATIDDLETKGKRALIVGGSGFYLKALVGGIWDVPRADPAVRAALEAKDSPTLYASLAAVDEATALRIGVNDRYRLLRAHEILQQSGKTPSELKASQAAKGQDPRFPLLWIDRDTPELGERIQLRTEQMIESGIIAETEWLQKEYPGARALEAIGYAETDAYLRDVLPTGRKIRTGLDGLADEIALSTRQLVKKQRTFFRNQFREAKTFMLEKDRWELLQELAEIYDARRSPP